MLFWHLCHRELYTCVSIWTYVFASVHAFPKARHYTTLVSCQNTGDLPDVSHVDMSFKAALSSRGIQRSIPSRMISLAVCGGCCFLAFQLFEHLAAMVSGGRAISPWLSPCRPSHWQEIRLHQYGQKVWRDLRERSYFSWSSTMRGGCEWHIQPLPPQKKKEKKRL